LAGVFTLEAARSGMAYDSILGRRRSVYLVPNLVAKSLVTVEADA